MALIKDIAIVIRRLDYSETSQVLVVFARETGQQRLIAKGVKRGTKSKAATGIDLLELGHVVYSRRPESEAQLGTLTEWRQEDVHPAIRRNLAAWYAAQYAADRTAQATQEGDPHVALFDALQHLLASEAWSRPLAALVWYLGVLLREVGLAPQFEQCVGCGAERASVPCLYFSARQGGLLCRDCEPAFVEKRRVEPATIDAAIRVSEWEELGEALRGDPPDGVLPGVFELMDYHLTEVLSKPSRVTATLRAAVTQRGR